MWRGGVGRHGPGPRGGVGRHGPGPRGGVGRHGPGLRGGVGRHGPGPRGGVGRHGLGPRGGVGRHGPGPRGGFGRHGPGPRPVHTGVRTVGQITPSHYYMILASSCYYSYSVWFPGDQNMLGFGHTGDTGGQITSTEFWPVQAAIATLEGGVDFLEWSKHAWVQLAGTKEMFFFNLKEQQNYMYRISVCVKELDLKYFCMIK